MTKEFIVAIELGSSKITGIAGKKNLDGSITILGVVQENSSQCIRRGVIYNIDKTMTALINIKQRLEKQLQTRIRQVYVGAGGQSILSIKNVMVQEMPAETKVTQGMVHELMDRNRNMNYPDREILDAVTLEYKVDNQLQTDPVGIQCTCLEGNFLNILWRKSFYNNLNRCFEAARIQIADLYLSPLTLAESVLVEAERRAGCLLVDLGAETTTVSVYYKNILRHLAVLPIGGANITRDITSLQMEEDEAERMKIKYGSAYTDSGDINSDTRYPIGEERTVDGRAFTEIVEARVEEIVDNALAQVPAEYADKLLGGIILTGGGANMRNIDKVFKKHAKMEKVRIARSVNQTVDATQPEVTAQDCRLSTALSLLAKGDMVCAGEPLSTELFGTQDGNSGTGSGEQPAGTSEQKTPEQKTELTDEEKKLIEKAKREQQEREEELKRQKEIDEQKEKERIKRQNSPFNRMMRSIKKFVSSAIEEEE